jgi:tetratricopeptide (TPR) repeat protein
MCTCYFCGDHEPLNEFEEWSSDGTSIRVPKSTVAWTVVHSSVGKLWICGICYGKNVFRGLRAEDRAEIHYSMGLEYYHLGQYPKSISALTKALKLKNSADILASLASNYSEIGDIKRAHKLYSQALELDSDHFMSRENLKNLGNTSPKQKRERKPRGR